MHTLRTEADTTAYCSGESVCMNVQNRTFNPETA